MEDKATMPLNKVVTAQPTSNNTDIPDDLGEPEPLNESQGEPVKKERRRDTYCCYNDCICDAEDVIDWFFFCRCIGHFFQSFGQCIGSCCEDCAECCQGCGDCSCEGYEGCCENGGDTVTDAADGADCDCDCGDCDCGDCDCFS